MTYSIDFVKYFSDEEKELVEGYIANNLENLELHEGGNYGVDVSRVVNRTANVDIYVEC